MERLLSHKDMHVNQGDHKVKSDQDSVSERTKDRVLDEKEKEGDIRNGSENRNGCGKVKKNDDLLADEDERKDRKTMEKIEKEECDGDHHIIDDDTRRNAAIFSIGSVLSDVD